MFEIKIDNSKFKGADIDFRKKWTIYTNGERIETFRNREKNHQWDVRTVNLTDELMALFKKHSISLNDDLKQQILAQDTKEFFASFMHILSLVLQMRNSEPNNVDVDYLISPVMDRNGKFYDSREYENADNPIVPQNADANGAYNIARKALWIIKKLKSASEEDLKKSDISISQKEWLEFAQK